LIDLYWQVGAHISRKLESAEWGEGVVDQLMGHLARTQPGLKGFTRRNLFRMRQFYKTYRYDEKVSPLVTQLSAALFRTLRYPAGKSLNTVERITPKSIQSKK